MLDINLDHYFQSIALGDGFDPLHGPGGSGEIPMVTLLGEFCLTLLSTEILYMQVPVSFAENDENIVFLDPDDSDEDLSKPLYLTIPYASGQAFPISSLDSLLSCVSIVLPLEPLVLRFHVVLMYSNVIILQTYLNGDVLTLVRALVTGTEIADYEIVLMEGLGITRRNTLADMSAARHRSHFAQLSLAYGPLEKLEVGLFEICDERLILSRSLRSCTLYYFDFSPAQLPLWNSLRDCTEAAWDALFRRVSFV